MREIFILIWILFINLAVMANGVGVINATTGTYLKLLSSEIDVYVENQVAVTKATMTFKNQYASAQNFKYAFPLPEGASATELKWYLNGIWYTAQIAEVPQDTTLPGPGGIHPDLAAYLGSLPLYFNIDEAIEPDSTTVIELTYVELLDYEFGIVNYSYPNDYQLIQIVPLVLQELNFEIVSGRTIETFQILSHNTTQYSNTGYNAFLQVRLLEIGAVQDYQIEYSLSLDELGLFSFSTYLPESQVPDAYGHGFFVFVAEPDPGNTTDIIDKVFTLIIDRSGSMGGDKIVQARNAAAFIVQNLNDGDKFNIVDFESFVYSFKPSHVPYNGDSRDEALAYINGISAGGGTNISGAFSTAIPQFSVANDSTANIIVFFTDGEATAGITGTNEILTHVQNLIASTETNISIFTFGIGDYTNQQLLTLLASQNNGLSVFLGSDELEEVITQFYLTIRNPVLLNTEMSFYPDILAEVYPSPLPNLYKGMQMIVSGRYTEAATVNLTLQGEAFGQPVQYDYLLELTDSNWAQYQFLPKIWAKQKIENLLVQYYSLDPTSQQAADLKNQIIAISIAYGVMTEFTSFTGGITSVEEEIETEETKNIPEGFSIIGNYPNPFNPSTTIRFTVGNNFNDIVKIKIYNSIGELVRVLTLTVNGGGVYEAVWDGLMQDGSVAPSDVYIYVVDFGNVVLANKMILMK